MFLAGWWHTVGKKVLSNAGVGTLSIGCGTTNCSPLSNKTSGQSTRNSAETQEIIVTNGAQRLVLPTGHRTTVLNPGTTLSMLDVTGNTSLPQSPRRNFSYPRDTCICAEPVNETYNLTNYSSDLRDADGTRSTMSIAFRTDTIAVDHENANCFPLGTRDTLNIRFLYSAARGLYFYRCSFL